MAEEEFYCENGVLGGDGYVYSANDYRQVLQIDTTNGNYIWIGDDEFCSDEDSTWWGDPIVGADQCIYWPPSLASVNRVLKFDPETQQWPSLVGDNLGGEDLKWNGGALSMDGGRGESIVSYTVPLKF